LDFSKTNYSQIGKKAKRQEEPRESGSGNLTTTTKGRYVDILGGKLGKYRNRSCHQA
jgi:hypothetical protein